MPVAPALAALRQALGRDDAAAVIADVDWGVFVPRGAAAAEPGHRLFQEVPEVAEQAEAAGLTGAPDPATVGPEALRARLREATAPQRESLVDELVFASVARALGHASADVIDRDKDFIELGFTSLTTMELTTMLTESTGLELSAAVIFDHPAPVSLASYLHAELVAVLAADHSDHAQHTEGTIDHTERT